jgi:CRP-like cAMP-binding protein
MWIDDFALAPQVKADFGALVWYLSYRHDVPLPNPAQDLYLFDGAKTAIESQITMTDVRRRVIEAPLMRDLDDEVIDELSATASVDQYRRGETIVPKGGQGGLSLLHRGRARLVLRSPDADADDVDVLDLEAGEVFGLLGHEVETDRAALVIALTDCEVVNVPAEAARRAISLAPGLASALEQMNLARQRRTARVLRRAVTSATDGDLS